MAKKQTKPPAEPEADEIVGVGLRIPKKVHDELRRISYERRASINSLLIAGAEKVIAEDKRK